MATLAPVREYCRVRAQGRPSTRFPQVRMEFIMDEKLKVAIRTFGCTFLLVKDLLSGTAISLLLKDQWE